MIKRSLMFLSKNIRNVLSSFVILVLIMSVASITLYLLFNLTQLNTNQDYSLVNIVPDYEEMYNFYDGDEQSSREESLNYNDVYEYASTLENFSSYRVDLIESIVIERNTYSYITFLPIIGENHIDFTSGNSKITHGSYTDDGVVISEIYAREYNLGVGSKLLVNSAFDLSLDEGTIQVDEASLFENSKVYELQVVGIYNYENLDDISSDYYYTGNETVENAPMYISNSEYNRLYTSFKNDLEKSNIPDIKYIQENIFAFDEPEYSRFLAEFKSKKSGNDFIEHVENTCDLCVVVNSSDELQSAQSPIIKLRTSINVIGIFVVVVGFIALFLNYYLLLEKRKDEIISLVAFGLSKTALRLQGFFEMLVLTILAFPISLLVVLNTVNPIVSLLERYYYIVVKNSIDGVGNEGKMVFTFIELPYYNVNVDDVVSFSEPNIYLIVAISLIVTIALVFISTVFEMSRRIKTYIRN